MGWRNLWATVCDNLERGVEPLSKAVRDEMNALLIEASGDVAGESNRDDIAPKARSNGHGSPTLARSLVVGAIRRMHAG